MKQRPRFYYTESQKKLMWDHWQKGDDFTAAQVCDDQKMTVGITAFVVKAGRTPCQWHIQDMLKRKMLTISLVLRQTHVRSAMSEAVSISAALIQAKCGLYRSEFMRSLPQAGHAGTL